MSWEKKQCLFLKQHQALWFGVNSNVGEIVFLFCLFCPNCVHIYIFALKMILTKLDHSVVYVITSAWWFLWQCFRKMDRLLILPRRWRTVVLICAWSYASSSVCLHPLLCRCIILTPIPTYTPSACLLCFYFFHLSKCNPFSKKGGKSQIKQNVWIWKSCKPLFKINITHHAKYNEMDSYECHISKALEIRACSSLLETTLHKHFEAEKTKCSSEINFFPIYAR